jgi:hypothetical protein
MQQFHANEDRFVVCVALVAKQIEDPADVGMSNFSCQVNFTLEARHCVGLTQDFRADGLDRYALAQFLVFGFIDLDHSATGDETDNAESAG